MRAKASAAHTPKDLLNLEDIQAALLTAAGVSDKATNYLEADDRREILREYIKNVREPASDKFVEKLVYRFLLTSRDTLGGKVRNLVGVWTQRQFTNYFISEFSSPGVSFAGSIHVALAGSQSTS